MKSGYKQSIEFKNAKNCLKLKRFSTFFHKNLFSIITAIFLFILALFQNRKRSITTKIIYFNYLSVIESYQKYYKINH